MIEKNLYTLCAILSLSCSAYAMDGEIDKVDSSSSMSMAGPSSSSPTPDQEIEEVSAQSTLFPYDKQKVTFTWPELEAAARNEKEDQRARNLLRYLGALREKYYYTHKEQQYGDPTRTYELPLLQEELSYNPTRRFRQGHLINPLLDKYGVYSELSMKIATIVGTHPTTKDAITQLSKLVGRTPYLADNHKLREMYLRRIVETAYYTIEAERKSAAQEKAALLSEVERLKAENEELKAQPARSSD